jgi:arsenite-transporting ATPase
VRTLLLTGPGGAGTTTLAAAAAVRSARSGRRTVLLTRQDHPVPRLAAEPQLDVVRVDPQSALEQLWGGASADVSAVLPQLTQLAPVFRIPEGGLAPADADELADLLREVDPTAPVAWEPPAPERHEGAWRLTVPLPFAERPAVHLTRWADDLVITVGGSRRSLRLVPLLRRCEVTGGRLADPGTPAARLEIGFRPDPQLWPADLLAAEAMAPKEATS